MIVVLLLSGLVPPTAAEDSGRVRFVPGEIIVKLRSLAADAQAEAPAASGRSTVPPGLQMLCPWPGVREIRPLGQQTRRQAWRQSSLTRQGRHVVWRLERAGAAEGAPDLDRIYRVKVDTADGGELGAVLQACREHPDVEYAELNPVVSICAEPDDPLYAAQWALQKVGAPEAWDTCRGTTEIVVAVIDTGVDYDHRDLQGNMWLNEAELHGTEGVDDDENGYVDDIRGYDFLDGDSDPIDDHGHGTHCAGTMAAIGDNGLDVTGMCWSSRIMPLKTLDAAGEGSAADAAVAIYYAVANGADVISSSWGGQEKSALLEDAVAHAHRKGVIVVAAAGNEASDVPFYPAAYPEVVSVAATESDDRRWSLSNHGDWVDIAAPGRNILSLGAMGIFTGSPHDAFTTRMSGTSASAPYVAGACALLLSANPFLTDEAVHEILMAAVDPIAPGLCVSNGRLNVGKAMQAAVPVRGMVRFDRGAYALGDEIGIFLADWHLQGAAMEAVTVETDAGDMEVVTLPETAWALGVFRTTVPSERAAPRPADGRLQVEHDERLVVRYLDLDDGSGHAGQWSEDDAYADYEPPAVLELIADAQGRAARIELVTSEPARVEIRYGTVPGGPYGSSARGLDVSTRHSVKLEQLVLRTEYHFIVSLVDPAGNESTTDNQGQDYSFIGGRDFHDFPVPGVYRGIQGP